MKSLLSSAYWPNLHYFYYVLHSETVCVEQFENYQKQKGLPENNDWETLRKFGFRDKFDYLQPEYRKLNEENFELIYVEGFDGPYLMWTSTERKWKEGYPTFNKSTENE